MDNKLYVKVVDNEVLTMVANCIINSLSTYLNSLPASRCTQQYETRQLTQQPQLYEICVKVKNQIRADGAMSLITKNNQGKTVKISIKTLSKYKSAFYKCEKQKNRLHFGVILQNGFTLNEEGGKNYEFSYCLVHSYVTSSDDKKAILKFEFKNDSNFSKELGSVVGSDKGIYLTNKEQISDKSATAQVLQVFADTVIDKPFGINGGFNCSHLVACLNFILAGEDYSTNYQRRYQRFIDDLPEEIKQLSAQN